jgi:hypothetical protein
VPPNVVSQQSQLVTSVGKQTKSTQHARARTSLHMSQRDDFIESQKSVHAPASHTV